MRSGLRPISMLSPTFRSRLTSRRDSTHTSPACGRPPACSAANGAAALLSCPRRVAVADRLDAAELDALVGGDHAGKLDAVGVAQAQTGAAFDLFGACRLGTVEHQVGAEELGGAGEHGAVQAGAEIANGGARGDRDQQGEEQHAQLAARLAEQLASGEAQQAGEGHRLHQGSTRSIRRPLSRRIRRRQRCARRSSWVTRTRGGTAFAVEFEEQVADPLAGGAVEVAGGFVGEQHVRLRREGAGNGDPLLLAAGELARIVAQALAEADSLEQFSGALASVGAAFQLQGQHHVLQRIEAVEQLERLEHEAYMGRADAPAGPRRGRRGRARRDGPRRRWAGRARRAGRAGSTCRSRNCRRSPGCRRGRGRGRGRGGWSTCLPRYRQPCWVLRVENAGAHGGSDACIAVERLPGPGPADPAGRGADAVGRGR